MLNTDGSLVCDTDPESIAYADGTRPCFTGLEAYPGALLPLDSITLVPFDEATVVDPSAVTIVPGGVITADGTDLCAVNPEAVVFPDNSYPCYIGYVQQWGPYQVAQEVDDEAPQVTQLPVGGADTGVEGVGGRGQNTGTVFGAGALGLGALAAGAFTLQARRRQ